MKPNEELRFCLETIEDLNNNKLAKEYFMLLENLIKEGHTLLFYRINDTYKFTEIHDLNHLKNFKNSFRLKF